jgi:hypothetical protein
MGFLLYMAQSVIFVVQIHVRLKNNFICKFFFKKPQNEHIIFDILYCPGQFKEVLEKLKTFLIAKKVKRIKKGR